MAPGTYRFIPSRSRAVVIAHAPGHNFRAEGSGLEGTVTIDASDTIVGATATFPLDALQAGDPIGTHELRKFLAGEKRASGAIADPVKVGSAGTLRLTIGARSMTTSVRLEGTPASAKAAMALTFTGLGWQPPKLLFLRVKDTFEVEISAQLERSAD